MAIGDLIKLPSGQWDPSNRFETSWLVSPYTLFFFRAFFSLYAFTTLFFILGWNCTHGMCENSATTWSYFTTLTYWGLAFYFLVSSVHTFSYARWGKPLLDSWPRTLQLMHGAYYSSITSFPLLVTIVYWTLLYSSWFTTDFAAWTNISQHAMNSGFALFEIFIPRTEPQPVAYLLVLIVILALYLALAYVTKATKGFYTYSFLDPSIQKNGLVAGYVFGILIAILVIFSIVQGLIWARKWLTETKLGLNGKFAPESPRARSSLRDEQEMNDMGSPAPLPDKDSVRHV